MSNLIDFIIKDIEKNILNNSYTEGEKLLSQTELKDKYKCGNKTISDAYNFLLNNNLIQYKRGIGYFVCHGSKERIKKKWEEDIMFDLKGLSGFTKYIDKRDITVKLNNLMKK